jgi:hypothetical protein
MAGRAFGSWLLLLASMGACGNTEEARPTASGGAGGAGGAGGSSDGAQAAAGSSADNGGQAGAVPGGGGDAGLAPTAGTAPSGGGMGGNAGESGEGGAPVGSAGEGGACHQACTSQNASAFCGQDEVTWVCQAGFDYELFNSECRDAATGAIRYCCPPSFKGECQ